MANDTDYKRLWRCLKDENMQLVNLLFQANERIKAQADIINKIKTGELKVDKVDAYRGDLLIKKLTEGNKGGI